MTSLDIITEFRIIFTIKEQCRDLVGGVGEPFELYVCEACQLRLEHQALL